MTSDPNAPHSMYVLADAMMVVKMPESQRRYIEEQRLLFIRNLKRLQEENTRLLQEFQSRFK